MKSTAELQEKEVPLPELNLLVDWEVAARPRLIRDGIGSIVIHVVVVILIFFVLQADSGRVFNTRGAIEIAELRKATPLVDPRPLTEFTQKAPNVNKATKEINLQSLLSPPVPASNSSRVKFKAPQPMRAPGPIAPPIAEPPKLEASLKAPQTALGIDTPLPPPQIEPVEKPKLAFETPGSQDGALNHIPSGKIQVPKATVEEAIRGVVSSAAGGGGQIVGDQDDPGLSDPLHPAPRRSNRGSRLELLSDPKGVDFRPYLIQVLASVRRNWLAIIPESARFGRRGRVQVQFIVARNGGVPKLVISMPSGADALDRAAVASISASNPFPPLPAEFKGPEVRLQLSFSYNTN